MTPTRGPERGWPRRPPLPPGLVRHVLREGEAELLGRMPWSSNATYMACLTDCDHQLLVVYKPRQGERPLWDFPRGSLCNREAAAFEVSEALGWRIVPETVVRAGPLGDGMMQRFVEHDPEEHYFTLLPDYADRLRRFAAFDVVVNNADRKGGHILRDPSGHLWGIDHGVTFHPQWKLRTVIWDFAGERLDEETARDLTALLDVAGDDLGARLRHLLSAAELDALRRRVERLLAAGALPQADPGHHSFPWPLV